MKRTVTLLWLLLLLAGGAVSAQDETDTETDGPQTTVEILFVACQDLGVMNLSGTAQPGFDIFYQLFNGSNGSGDPLTGLRRINASGEYNFSERITYANGQLVAPGNIASARVLIAAVDTPDSPDFETFVDDLQDGCNDAQNPLQDSSGDGVDPVVEEADTTANTFGIASPDGGFINNDFNADQVVVLGPRDPAANTRARSPGLVFAQCDAFPSARPGTVYDSDEVRVFWYWFANTRSTLEENLARTNYNIRINNAPVSLDQLIVSPIEQRNSVFYRFYTLPIENLRPGFYKVDFQQTWSQPINDGFENYGPGTANPAIVTGCNFEVTRNPFGIDGIRYSGLYIGAETPFINERDRVQQQVFDDLRDAAGN